MLPSQFDVGSGEQTPVRQQRQHFKYEPSKDSITTPTVQLHHTEMAVFHCPPPSRRKQTSALLFELYKRGPKTQTGWQEQT